MKRTINILLILLLSNPVLQGASDGTSNANTELVQHSGNHGGKHHNHTHKKHHKAPEVILVREIHRYRYHISIITALTTIIGAWYKLLSKWNSSPVT